MSLVNWKETVLNSSTVVVAAVVVLRLHCHLCNLQQELCAHNVLAVRMGDIQHGRPRRHGHKQSGKNHLQMQPILSFIFQMARI